MSDKTKANEQSRRTFIKTASGALIAVSANSILPGITLGDSKEIRLGGLCEMSGPAAAIGVSQAQGIELAVDMYNRKGGVLGKKIKLYNEDTECKKDVGLTKARRLVERKGVEFVTGICYSSISMAIQPYLRDKKTIFVNTASGNDLLAQPPLCNRYFFKSCSSVRGSAAGMMMYPKIIKGNRWFFTADNYSYGKLTVEMAIKAMKKTNPDIEIVGTEYTNLGETNYSPYLTKIMVEKPDVVYMCQFGAGYSRIIKQAYQMGLSRQTQLSHTFFSYTDAMAAGNGILGMICGAVFVKENPYAPRSKEFTDKFKKKYGYYSGWGGAFGFNGVEIIMEAVKAAGTTETEAVVDAIENMHYKDLIVDNDCRFRKCDHQLVTGGGISRVIKHPKYKYSQEIIMHYTAKDVLPFLIPEGQTGCEPSMKRGV